MTQSITRKQEEILKLIYKYRFLNRIQIQAFLNHKYHKRINDWLNDLTEKEYTGRIYSNKFGENTKPAIYYIESNGIGFIKTEYNFSSEYLTKLYRKKDLSEDIISQCALIADIALTLKNRSDQSKKKKSDVSDLSYLLATAIDLFNPDYHFNLLAELKTDLLIKKQETTGKKTEITFFLFTMLVSFSTNQLIRKRIKDIIDFYIEGEWYTIENELFPTIMVICPKLYTLIYAKRLTRRLLEEEDNPEDLQFQFTTVDQLKKHGVSGDIWEEANIKYDEI